MLDELPLAEKLQIAAAWFRRADDGQMPFTRRTAQRFSDLLGQCAHEAAMLDARLEIERASLALLEGRPAPVPLAQLRVVSTAKPDGTATLLEGKP